MLSVDLILTFRGIAVPTIKMIDKDACGLSLQRIVEGHEQKSDQVLFAYKYGITWKTTLVGIEPGQYRVTLISNDFDCSGDFTIDEGVIAKKVLRIGFNERDCRRKLFPVALKRLWWQFSDFLEKRRDHPNRDARVLSRYRRRYRRGPVGAWLSCHDHLTLYGTSIVFSKDFTGCIYTWGSDEAEVEQEFRWRCLGDYSIDVEPLSECTYPEDWGKIEYDFRISRSQYGTRQVLMYSKKNLELNSDEPGFWWSLHDVSLVK